MVNDSACVELARLPDAVGLRDSKHPQSGHLALSGRSFSRLIAQVKHSQR